MPFADINADGFVDMSDFAIFQLCYFGQAGNTPATIPGINCSCFDRNGDGLIDTTDMVSFQNCATGPDIPWSQALAPTCTP